MSKVPSIKEQQPYSVTVCDGTTTENHFPIYGEYLRRGCYSQMIYPSNLFGSLKKGDKITKLTFYATSNISSNWNNNTITLRLGETAETAVTSNDIMTANRNNCTQVFSGNITGGSNTLTITLASPYNYRGGNLIVDLVVSTGDNNDNVNTSWYGVDASNASYCRYRTGQQQQYVNYQGNFLPKMKVDYTRLYVDVEPRNIVVKDSTFFKAIDYQWPIGSPTNTSYLNEIATDPEQIIAMMRKVYMDKSIPGNLKRGFNQNGGNEEFNDVDYAGIGAVDLMNISRPDLNTSYEYVDEYGWNIPGDNSKITAGSGTAEVYVSSILGGYYTTRNFNYAYLDPTEYKPDKEGLTLMLAELVDNFDFDSVISDINQGLTNGTISTGYEILREMIKGTIKSLRIIPEAIRTGDGLESGTLFKIDCNKMNKFFLLAKGQVRWIDNAYTASNGNNRWLEANFCEFPCYIYDNYYGSYTSNNSFTGFHDGGGWPFFHMFEQFSPVVSDAQQGLGDIYQELINMESFGVEHDCLSVPSLNHQFMMYGDNTVTADCQDIRDLMFFIPDYRMIYEDDRDYIGDQETGYHSQRFMNYNTAVQPQMGLYVIRQDEITPTTEADDYYMLNLHWRTNLDDFLPGEDQEFELFQVVYNEETGIEEYVSVYYMNAQGQYTDADGHVVDEANKVPIVLHLGTGEEKSYSNVYVKRLEASQQVTYAIRGRDAGHFLSLQMSNLQSYIIPGTDPAELVSLVELTHYSRYNPQNEKNCYSNRFKMINNVGGVKRADLTQSGSDSQTMFTFYRKSSASDAGVPIATATVTRIGDDGGTFTITMQNQSLQTEYPKAKIEGGYAGYHPNPGENNVWTANFTYTTINDVQYVNFGDNFILCDNFTVDVSSNEHPNLYIYEVKFNVPQGQYDFTEAHGNAFRVPIYKTDSRINGVFTKEEVDNDINGQVGTIENVEFEEQVQYSSRTEILRYDAFRYNEQDEERYIFNKVFNLGEDESIVTPNGIASNQGGSYTPTMGETTSPDYYAGDAVSVNVGQTAWAKFVDKYPTNTTDAGAYLYAPVVEVFSVGKNSEGNVRTDYNYYGGPMQSTAVGKLAVARDNTPELMSTYNWTAGGKKYAYYNIILNVSTKDVPTGYQIYKIRAWRTVDPSILGEEIITERLGDENGKYMFEEINFGTEAMDNFINNGYEPGAGDASVTVNGDNISYTLGTFGAQKLRTDEEVGDNSVIDELNATFVVRMYFTRAANLSTTSGAPMLKDVATDADGKYYIVEQVIPFTQKGGNVPTGLESLNARQVVGVKYYNVAGIESDAPFHGVNIMVTRYSDGSSTTTKILK